MTRHQGRQKSQKKTQIDTRDYIQQWYTKYCKILSIVYTHPHTDHLYNVWYPGYIMAYVTQWFLLTSKFVLAFFSTSWVRDTTKKSRESNIYAKLQDHTDGPVCTLWDKRSRLQCFMWDLQSLLFPSKPQAGISLRGGMLSALSFSLPLLIHF